MFKVSRVSSGPILEGLTSFLPHATDGDPGIYRGKRK